MTPRNASAVGIAATVALFLILCAFNVGRLTTPTLTIKDGCGQTLSYSTPFKGTLP